MKNIFLDTSGMGHLFVQDQIFHESAFRLYFQRISHGAKVILTNHIITEFVALSASRLNLSRPGLIKIVNDLYRSRFVEQVFIDKMLYERAWQLLCNRPDKAWSLVDCCSFIVMQDRGISDALTTDHHFTQAGFNVLLK